MPVQVPQHPGNAQQQTIPQNPYYTPNQGLQQAQAAEAQAMANKYNAESRNLQQGLGEFQQEASVPPQQVQAEQIAEGILNGSVDNRTLTEAVQRGEVGLDVAKAAIGMAQEIEARATQPQQGLAPTNYPGYE